jgi:hypothetical protein
MPYTAEISRTTPTCFLLLVDQSGSMAKPFGGKSGKSKAEGVAEAVNPLLQTLVARCTKGEHILDRYLVGVIGYGAGLVFPGFSIVGLTGDVLQPVSRIGACPRRVEDRIQRVDDGAGACGSGTSSFRSGSSRSRRERRRCVRRFARRGRW